MRVALDATYSIDPQPSGISQYSRHLLNTLPELFPQDRFDAYYRPRTYFRAPASRWKNFRKRIFLPPLPTFGIDVFHALNQRVDRRPAAKVVSTFHDLFVMTGNYSTDDFKTRFTTQAREAAARSDLIIAISEFTAHQVHHLLGIDRARIRVVPHGVEQPESQRERVREPLVLFVGALQHRKNLTRLIEAFEAMPDRWRLVLAGSHRGFRAQEVLDCAARSRAQPRIQLPGYLNERQLEELYHRAAIFAFPSLDEGFGMPVLEAMSYGVPVVTSNQSALVEVAGTAAYLIDPTSVDELRVALLRLAEDEALRERYEFLGKEHSRTFTWEASAHKTRAVYQELTGTSR